MEAARKALARNKGKDWASAPGAVRAKYLRAIAAKVLFSPGLSLIAGMLFILVWILVYCG